MFKHLSKIAVASIVALGILSVSLGPSLLPYVDGLGGSITTSSDVSVTPAHAQTSTLADYLASPGGDAATLTSGLRGLLPFRGARVWMTSDDTTINATSTPYVLTFDEAVFDTDSFWDNTNDTTKKRFTIPAGISRVEVNAQVFVSDTTADTYSSFVIRKHNSSNTLLEQFWPVYQVEKGGTWFVISGSSGPVPVSTGDYFLVDYREESDNSITIEGDDATTKTFMSIKVLPM